tara:strand:+ start:2558 stop:3499 length:942 start_codon:yes stop_codon:yes gene_type:complete
MTKSRLSNRLKKKKLMKWPIIVLAIFSSIGVIDTGSITLKKWGLLNSLTCPGSNQGCEKVLNSDWGTIFSLQGFHIPLSFVGFVAYLLIFISAIILIPLHKSKSNTQDSIRIWWGMFYITCSMSVFSIFLILVMTYQIKAFCLFCMLSAILSLIMFLTTIIGGNWTDRSKLFFRGFWVFLLVISGSLIWNSKIISANAAQSTDHNETRPNLPPIVQSKSSEENITLAKYLSKKGIKMYSAYWCPHCHDQKEIFGNEAVKELTIIECAEDGFNNNHKLCTSKGITGYPSWEINGKIEMGIQSLKELSIKSGYIN